MDALETLLAIEEIKKLKGTYFRSLDTKDETLYRSLLTEDYSFDAPEIVADPVSGYRPFPGSSTVSLRGRDQCAETIFAGVHDPEYSSVHHGHMPEIDIIDPENARAIWSMTDVVYSPRGDGTKLALTGYGFYHDTYRREEGKWKIASVKLTRIRIDYPFEKAWRKEAGFE